MIALDLRAHLYIATRCRAKITISSTNKKITGCVLLSGHSDERAIQTALTVGTLDAYQIY